MSIENKTYYDWQRRRFGSPVDMADEHGDITIAEPVRPEIAQSYGSNTRYNQLQNHPYNTTMGIPTIPGYDTEEYIEQLMDGRENNIMDMDAVRNISQNNLSLNDILADQFGSITRRNQLQNFPYNTIDYTPEETRYMQPNNIDDVLFYLNGINQNEGYQTYDRDPGNPIYQNYNFENRQYGQPVEEVMYSPEQQQYFKNGGTTWNMPQEQQEKIIQQYGSRGRFNAKVNNR